MSRCGDRMLSSPRRFVNNWLDQFVRLTDFFAQRHTRMKIAIDPVRTLVVDLFVAQGAPPAHAEIVAGHLIESSRMGLHSHGLIRVPQYVDAVASGASDPPAAPRRHEAGAATCRLHRQWGCGQLTAA